MTVPYGLNAAVMFVLAHFELGFLLQRRQHPNISAQQVSLMFAECSLVMLGANAMLIFTALLEKASSRKLIGARLLLAMGELAAAAGIGQTLGSSAGGWLFSAIEQRSFGWLAAPLAVVVLLLLARPRWDSAIPGESS